MNNPVITLQVTLNQAVENLEKQLEAIGAKQPRARILLLLALTTGKETATEIGACLGISRQAVHQTVHEMIADGLVVLAPYRGDRRAKLIKLTPMGTQIADVLAKASESIAA